MQRDPGPCRREGCAASRNAGKPFGGIGASVNSIPSYRIAASGFLRSAFLRFVQIELTSLEVKSIAFGLSDTWKEGPVPALSSSSPLVFTASTTSSTSALVEFARRLGAPAEQVQRSDTDESRAAVAINAALAFILARAAAYFARHRLASDADIQDCVQTTTISLWRKLSGPNAAVVRNPQGYFIQVIHNVAANHWKATATYSRRTLPLSSVPEPKTVESHPQILDFDAFCRYLEDRHASVLVRTLYAYRQSGGSIPDTCAVLRVKKKTLYRRLMKIKEYAQRYLLENG